ncbi:hypothetical protein GCM10010199_72780 [Dactylosporangium roseum]
MPRGCGPVGAGRVSRTGAGAGLAATSESAAGRDWADAAVAVGTEATADATAVPSSARRLRSRLSFNIAKM